MRRSKKLYGLMTYDFKSHFNIGDYIQSIAARQFLPQVDCFINREKMDIFNGPEVKMIMNGWYMHLPQNWPISEKINPLFISFHINSKHVKQLLNAEGVAYLKKHEPIGCRDTATLKFMQEKGIAAYHSGCLTLTLGNSFKRSAAEVTDEIYFVDVMFKAPSVENAFRDLKSFLKSVRRGEIFKINDAFNVQRKIFGDDILRKAHRVEHIYAAAEYPTEEARFDLAEKLLKKYLNARLVVTSRIHCALPCLAMGVPVIFIDGGFIKERERCRFSGVSSLFNCINVDEKGDFTANFDTSQIENMTIENKQEYKSFLDTLNKTCIDFCS